MLRSHRTHISQPLTKSRAHVSGSSAPPSKSARTASANSSPAASSTESASALPPPKSPSTLPKSPKRTNAEVSLSFSSWLSKSAFSSCTSSATDAPSSVRRRVVPLSARLGAFSSSRLLFCWRCCHCCRGVRGGWRRWGGPRRLLISLLGFRRVVMLIIPMSLLSGLRSPRRCVLNVRVFRVGAGIRTMECGRGRLLGFLSRRGSSCLEQT